MAGTAPTYYDLSTIPNFNGLLKEDVHRLAYDLYLMAYYLCNNIDDDAGVIAADYVSKLAPSFMSSGGGGQVPLGAADSTSSLFYTPSHKLNWNGMSDADIYTAFFDVAVALYEICSQLDDDTGGALGTDFASNISTPLTATLGSKITAPAEGLLTSTYFYGMDGFMADGCYTDGDLYKVLYNLYIAVVRICAILDAGAGTLPTTLLAGVGTPLNTAIGKFIKTPHGATTKGS